LVERTGEVATDAVLAAGREVHGIAWSRTRTSQPIAQITRERHAILIPGKLAAQRIGLAHLRAALGDDAARRRMHLGARAWIAALCVRGASERGGGTDCQQCAAPHRFTSTAPLDGTAAAGFASAGSVFCSSARATSSASMTPSPLRSTCTNGAGIE